MTKREYEFIEREALRNLRRLLDICPSENIVFIMSRDIYLAAREYSYEVRLATDHSEDGTRTGIYSVYRGYDIFIANEENHPLFQPAIRAFGIGGFDYYRLSEEDLVLSDMKGENLRVFYRAQGELLRFNDAHITVCREYKPVASERVTFADRIRAAQEHEIPGWQVQYGDWTDWVPQATPRPDFLSDTINWPVLEEFDRQLNAAPVVQGFKSTNPWKMIVTPAKEWDEKLTPEDTKELDDFLDGLARKDPLE